MYFKLEFNERLVFEAVSKILWVLHLSFGSCNLKMKMNYLFMYLGILPVPLTVNVSVVLRL